MLISSWGRLNLEEQELVAVTGRESVRKAFERYKDKTFLPRGNGRSYGDVCNNKDGVLLWSGYLDNFISFDAEKAEVTCGSGVILRNLQRFLVRNGFMLPVTPGTQMISVGGAIANEVHCKKHHRFGTFGNHVKSFRLLRSDGEILDCSPEKNSGYYRATIGGIGLTGFILDATLSLKKVAGPWIIAENIPYYDLKTFFDLANSSEKDYEHTVSWIDCITGNGERGIFMRGNNDDTDTSGRDKHPGLSVKVPFTMPFSLVNTPSLYCFNKMYFALQCLKKGPFKVHYEKFFYPLDGILEWNRIYGPKGFFQYQCVVPTDTGLDAVQEMQKVIAESGQGSFLGVLKTFGDYKSVGMLSFPYKGFTYALDFPNRGESTLKLLSDLDAIVKNAHGRLYTAKDARQPREMFESGYGTETINEFLKYRDPKMSSDMSRRLMGV